jgi:hypothetical protein
MQAILASMLKKRLGFQKPCLFKFEAAYFSWCFYENNPYHSKIKQAGRKASKQAAARGACKMHLFLENPLNIQMEGQKGRRIRICA